MEERRQILGPARAALLSHQWHCWFQQLVIAQGMHAT